jgi:hypothetical protein
MVGKNAHQGLGFKKYSLGHVFTLWILAWICHKHGFNGLGIWLNI